MLVWKTLSCLRTVVDQDLALVDGEGRLLALDVLAGADRHDAHQRVPVVGGGDHHRVDVVAGEDLAEVVGGGAVLVAVVFVDHALGPAQVAAVDVADGEDPGVLLLQVVAEVAAGAVAADADEADGDLVARGVGAEDAGGDDRGGGEGGGGGADEVAAGDGVS